MNRLTALGGLGCLGILLLGVSCATAPSTGGDAMVLEGSWELSQILNVSGEMVPPVPNSLTWFELSDGTVTGNAGANNFTGGYELNGSKIKFLPTASNMMMGTPELMAQESQFMKGLGEAVEYQMVEGELHLRNAEGAVVIKMKPRVEPGLTSGVWKATGVNNGKGGVASILRGTELTIRFGEDGRVSGSSGCNSFSGSYELKDDQIKFSPLAGTRKMCSEPEGIMDQESAFLQALGKAVVWNVEAGSLELRDEAGALQAKFMVK